MGRERTPGPKHEVQRVVYTEEMLRRALAQIAERRKQYSEAELFGAYMQVMHRAFVRRLKRDHPEVFSAAGLSECPAPSSEPRVRPKKLRRLRGETDDQRKVRIKKAEAL